VADGEVWPVYFPKNVTSGILSLSRKEIHVASESTMSALSRATRGPTYSKVVLSRSQLKISEYTLEERAKMGRYDVENGPTKFARCFSQASCYVIVVTSFLWLRDRIAMFKTCDI